MTTQKQLNAIAKNVLITLCCSLVIWCTYQLKGASEIIWDSVEISKQSREAIIESKQSAIMFISEEYIQREKGEKDIPLTRFRYLVEVCGLHSIRMDKKLADQCDELIYSRVANARKDNEHN